MPLPKWAVERRFVKVIESPEDRFLARRVEKSEHQASVLFMKESLDLDSYFYGGPNTGDYYDSLTRVEYDYEGSTLNYHGYTFI